MQLRYYQVEAVKAAYQYLRDNPGKNPCIVLPTGAGKTPVLAKLCRDAVVDWNGRVLVLSHVKELVEQSAETLRAWYPFLEVGVYSAGVGKRETSQPVIVAGIQSVASRGFELCGERPFNLVIVDEAHRIPIDGEGQYVSLLRDLQKANPKVRVIGLTATNYRTDTGYVCGDDHFLNEVCYEASVKELIARHFLCRLISKEPEVSADMSQVSIRRGEFASAEMEDAFEEIVESAIEEILKHAEGRKSVLLFCAGVDHAYHVSDELAKRGVDCPVITGQTNAKDREEIIKAFKTGQSRFLANVNVLTEGFDARQVDMVVLLRATTSPGLYYQMVGRGLRYYEGKEDCKVLDFGGNVSRHGCIDEIKIKDKTKTETGEAPTRTCPECKEIVTIQSSVCTVCGFEFPQPEQKPRHEPTASSAAILSDQIKSVEWIIDEVDYVVHKKRGASETAPRTMRVMYYQGLEVVAEEWICIEHPGWARSNAMLWWRERSTQECPTVADDAVQIAKRGGLAEPWKIYTVTKPGERFAKIIKYELGPIPEPIEVLEGFEVCDLDDEVPF